MRFYHAGVLTFLPSSKKRFTEFLAKRREDKAKAKSEAGRALEAETRAKTKSEAAAAVRDWTLTPDSRGKRKANRPIRELAREFLSVLRGQRWKVYFAIGTVILATMIGLITPIGAKLTLDYCVAPTEYHLEQLRSIGWENRRVELAWWIGLASVTVTFLSVAVQMTGRAQLTRLNKVVQSRVRRRVFDHMSRLPLHKLSNLKSGGVSSILREDAGGVGEMLFIAVYNPVRALTMMLGGLGMMSILDWRLSAMGALLLPAVYFTHRTWIGNIRPIFSAVKQQRTNTDAQATEAFAGMRIVRSFDRRRGESTRFGKNNHMMARQEMLVWWWSRFIEMLWIVIMPLTTAAALAYGTSRVLDAKLTIGDLGAFLTYLGMILGPMELLVGTASQLQNTLAGWDRCLDVLAEKPELTAGGADSTGVVGGGGAANVNMNMNEGTRGEMVNGSTPAPGTPAVLVKSRVHGEVELRGVSFTYPGSVNPVLNGIDLRVEAGATVALVGASGSGKTTLCNLVARFYDPSAGAVLLDGVDLRRIEVDSFRRILGIVEQDVFLFDGTIAENIGYANRDATAEQIVAAAQAANAAEFIDAIEKKYDTLIGERGVRLSGGQKQRIAIARAILADPRVLILDEATSNLDTQSERLIQHSLAELMKGRTCFVIAHRLSTIRDADLIVVLEKGRIVETGTHEALVEKRGNYFAMLQVQLHTAKDYAA